MTKAAFSLFPSGVFAVAATLIGAQAQAQSLNLSSWVPPTHFIHTDFLVPFAERVAEVTGGRVTLNILPAPLGGPAQHWELVRNGIADITWGNFTYEPERFIPMWFAEFPNAGTNAEAQSVALWRAYEEYLSDNPAFAGVKMLGLGLFGGGQLHHGARAITTPADISNQKFRMGGPIQERMLTALGAVPVAAPATRAYEMLESGVIDGSLHPVESVMNFRLEGVLTHHTIFPNGFYDATFFVAMNEARWNRLSEADRDAIAGITGEMLSAAWGRNFDQQHPVAVEKLTTAGNSFTEASEELIGAVNAIYDEMVADWIVAAKGAGVADPEALLAFYQASYADFVGE
ncbi:MAG: ABC transporter substrate-binding protein [Rhodobacteraceae bacterium]|nr:MAG: ABC transporter substrate-binding protein [Paracoccaceae bacterium]